MQDPVATVTADINFFLEKLDVFKKLYEIAYQNRIELFISASVLMQLVSSRKTIKVKHTEIKTKATAVLDWVLKTLDEQPAPVLRIEEMREVFANKNHTGCPPLDAAIHSKEQRHRATLMLTNCDNICQSAKNNCILAIITEDYVDESFIREFLARSGVLTVPNNQIALEPHFPLNETTKSSQKVSSQMPEANELDAKIEEIKGEDEDETQFALMLNTSERTILEQILTKLNQSGSSTKRKAPQENRQLSIPKRKSKQRIVDTDSERDLETQTNQEYIVRDASRQASNEIPSRTVSQQEDPSAFPRTSQENLVKDTSRRSSREMPSRTDLPVFPHPGRDNIVTNSPRQVSTEIPRRTDLPVFPYPGGDNIVRNIPRHVSAEIPRRTDVPFFPYPGGDNIVRNIPRHVSAEIPRRTDVPFFPHPGGDNIVRNIPRRTDVPVFPHPGGDSIVRNIPRHVSAEIPRRTDVPVFPNTSRDSVARNIPRQVSAEVPRPTDVPGFPHTSRDDIARNTPGQVSAEIPSRTDLPMFPYPNRDNVVRNTPGHVPAEMPSRIVPQQKDLPVLPPTRHDSRVEDTSRQSSRETPSDTCPQQEDLAELQVKIEETLNFEEELFVPQIPLENSENTLSPGNRND